MNFKASFMCTHTHTHEIFYVINLSSIPLQSLSLLVFLLFLFLINFAVLMMMMRILMSFPTAYLFDDLPHTWKYVGIVFNFSISVNVHYLLPFPLIPASYSTCSLLLSLLLSFTFSTCFFLCRFILNPHHNILAENVINMYVHRQWLWRKEERKKERNFQFEL